MSDKKWGFDGQKEFDLDQAIKELQDKFRGLFSKDLKNKGYGGIGIIFIVLFILWMASGFYVVDPSEKGVETRFGIYKRTTDQGPHWHLPYPIEKKEIVNVTKIRTINIGFRNNANRISNNIRGEVSSESLMLTEDENIISIKFAVQYKVKDAKDYLFNVFDPDQSLRNIVESVVRQVIGKNKMDYILTDGRTEINDIINTQVQILLDQYGTGLELTSVNMQDAQPPEQVQEAFSDVVKAREDKQRLINEAQAYANDIVPKARGEKSKIIKEAEAYKQSVISKAKGESSRFSAVRKEFEQAPEVTRKRLYLETIEDVFKDGIKVISNPNSNNLMFLPLDKIIDRTFNKEIYNNSPSSSNETSFKNNDSNNRMTLSDILRSRGSK